MSGGRPKPPGTALTSERNVAARKRLPTVQVVPPISDLLTDIYAVAKTELRKMRAKQAKSGTDEPTPGLARDLDSLAGAVVKASKRDAEVQREMAEELALASEEDLRKLAGGEDDGNG